MGKEQKTKKVAYSKLRLNKNIVNELYSLTNNEIDKKLILYNYYDFFKGMKLNDLREYKTGVVNDLSMNESDINFIKSNAFILKNLERINHNEKSKNKRVKEKIKKMITFSQKNADFLPVFITFTFNNDFLETSTLKTKRIYLTRFFKDNDIFFYVANVDFSPRQRIHFHALALLPLSFYDKIPITCLTKSQNSKRSKWTYGFVDYERINTTETDMKRLSKYIVKFANHATKDSTKGFRLITSRNFNQINVLSYYMEHEKPIFYDYKQEILIFD